MIVETKAMYVLYIEHVYNMKCCLSVLMDEQVTHYEVLCRSRQGWQAHHLLFTAVQRQRLLSILFSFVSTVSFK